MMNSAVGRTARLFDYFYYLKPGFIDGTNEFHEMIGKFASHRLRILEIGAGPDNVTSAFLASIGTLVGVDVSNEIRQNRSLSEYFVYDGENLPFGQDEFDLCVSNYVLEHVPNPIIHFREIHRVLKCGGRFIFRTPNVWHYVTLASWLLPHGAHTLLANRLRALGHDAHDPYPTVYEANTAHRLRQLAERSGLRVEELRMIEKEPSYGKAHWLLFYPMMGYERLVNSSRFLERFRANILGVLKKS